MDAVAQSIDPMEVRPLIFEKRLAVVAISWLFLASSSVFNQTGGVGTLAQRIGHYDSSKARHSSASNGNPGSFELLRLLGPNSLSTMFQFLDILVVNPHSGLGQHFHDNCEETFVSLEGPDAQFTINGRTSVLKTPAGAPDRMGSAHAFYNPNDQPLLWLDIGVEKSTKSTFDSFRLGDDRVDVPLDKVPQFVNFHMDPALLKPVANLYGGKGTVMYRRLLGPTVFLTPWAYLDEISIPSGSTIGPVTEAKMSEAYYVISGEGTVTVNGETVSLKKSDAVPVDIGQTHSFTQVGSEPLHLLVTGVAKDEASKRAFIEAPETRALEPTRPGFPPAGRP
jgi:mannose-6-phosphate isomerase-like protein (cupin superfamily)